MVCSKTIYFRCSSDEKPIEITQMNNKQDIVRWFNVFCRYYDGLYSYEGREEFLDLNIELLLETCKKYK